MKDLNFPLKQNLILHATGDLRKGYFLFPAVEFGLTYFVTGNPRSEEISISLCVVHMESGEIVYNIGMYTITSEGFPVKVGEEIVYINKYSEVIGYFNGDGSLTDDGVIWAKATTFNNQTIGDYI